MIYLGDLIDELVAAEGSQTAMVVTKSTGEVSPTKVNSIIKIINAGLIDIFKRFYVANTEHILNTTTGTGKYLIDPANVKTDANPTGFIEGDPNFNVIAITSVRTADCGRQLPLNTQNKMNHAYAYTHNNGLIDANNVKYGVYTSRYNVLHVPESMASSRLILSLRVCPSRIDEIPDDQVETFDYNSVVIPLPPIYTTALVYYVIARLSNPKGAETIGRTIFHEGNNYFQKYLQECESLKASDSEVSEIPDMGGNKSRFGFI